VLEYAFQKDIGGREDQQDNVKILEKGNEVFIVLGDGMGGHEGGNFASKTLVEVASYFFENYSKKDEIKEFFDQIIKEVVKKLTIHAQKTGEDPRTTAVFVLIIENEIHFANIGDSRIYLFKKDRLVTRSRDHSVPEMLFQMGEIQEEEIATHPDQNKLLKSVGPDSQDMPTYNKYLFEANEEFGVLVCSDGLWEYVTENEMRNFIFKDFPKEAVAKMIMIAKKRGGKKGDNISVGIVRKRYSNTNKKEIEKKENKWRNVLLLVLSFFLLGVGSVYLFFRFTNIKTINKQNSKDKNQSLHQKVNIHNIKTINKQSSKDKNQSLYQERSINNIQANVSVEEVETNFSNINTK